MEHRTARATPSFHSLRMQTQPGWRAALVLAALCAGVRAQQDIHVQRLLAPEPAQREDARRRLALLPRAELPADDLLRCVAEGGVAAPDAMQVLALHADLADAARRQVALTGASPALITSALPVLRTADLWQLAFSLRAEAGKTADRALAEVARRGELFTGAIADLLGADDAPGSAAFAAELVAHGELPPPAVQAAIDASASARHRMLRALADYPREDFAAWIAPWLERDDATTVLLTLAALPPSRHTPAHARLVLRLLTAETAPFLPDLAASRFSAKIADGLVAAAHGALVAGSKLNDLLPLLRSVSAQGEAHLLGLALTLDQEAQEEVCRWLDARNSKLLRERITQALDGAHEVPVCLLRRAGSSLTTRTRIDRVVAELAALPARAEAAFTALIEADCYDKGMLAVVHAEPALLATRTRELLRLSRGVLPIDVAHGFLDDADPTLRLSAVHYLAAPGITEATERKLAELLAEDPDDRVRGACARALSVLGSDERAAAAFEQAFGSAYGEAAVEWLIERPRPFALALLQRLRANRHGRWADEIDTGRVRLGDAAPLPALLDRIHELPLRLVRRLAPALRDLDAAATKRLVAAASNQDLDVSVRECVIDALAAEPAAHAPLLQRLYEREDDDGVRAAALRGLLQTPVGAGMLRDLHAALGQRPLRSSDEDMAFEILDAARLPLPEPIVEFAARCVLEAPLANPVGEAELALSDRGEVADYPLMQPLAELIRRAALPAHGEAIARAVAQARAHKNAHALSRRRLGRLLGSLTLAERAFLPAAPALARAIVDAPDRDARWLGPAWAMLARDLEAKGDLAAAADAYARAREGFLCTPPPAVQRRRFMLDPDPARGLVPMGELAARPHLLRARMAVARGDREGARVELLRAQTRASADAGTLAEIEACRAQAEGK
jgi:tetratricopeptide (TPR) repeat protein